jgi:tetratricopeptide (TPR) repeat protein
VDCGFGKPSAHARLLRRLGVPRSEIPDEPGEARALYLAALDKRSVLIIADDVTTASQVAELASASPDCAVIATSRLRLAALDDCQPILLPPLGDDAGVSLFRAVSGRGDLGDDEEVRRIVAACGGLPLAIRVAAVRTRDLGRDSAEMAALLEDPSTMWAELDDGERVVQRVLDEEVAALSVSAQRTMALLALHPGRLVARQPAAWLVDRMLPAIDPDLAELTAHHLVTAHRGGSVRADGLHRTQSLVIAAGIDKRSRADALARLVSGYARAATAASGSLAPTRFQPPAASAGRRLMPLPLFGSRAEAMSWFQAEADLIPRLCSLALELGLDEECWRLAYAMRDYFLATVAVKPWIASHRIALLAAQRSGDPWAEATTRNNLGIALVEGRQPLAAQEHYRLALDLLRGIGDDHGIAAAVGHQAWAHHAAGQHGAAISLAEQARQLHKRHGNERSLAIMDRTAALALAKSGQHREALVLLAECQEVLAGLDLPLDVAMTLNCLGEVHQAMGHYGRALVFHGRAAEHAVAYGGASEQARALRGLEAASRVA